MHTNFICDMSYMLRIANNAVACNFEVPVKYNTRSEGVLVEILHSSGSLHSIIVI
jgi:hypothetical protein